MIWLAWRQFRSQAVTVFGSLAVLAVLVIVTGLQLRHYYDTSGITSCGTVGDCDAVVSTFVAHFSWLQTLIGKILLLLLPAVTGVFWGAPLVARELDTGSYRLAWTQSITRTRWLSAKLAVVGTASVAASALLSLLTTWWFSPIDRLENNRFEPSIFEMRNLVPVGYAAFAFAFGVLAGLLLRRTLPAMATTLVGFIAARLAVVIWLRPHLRSPLHASIPFGPDKGPGSGPLDPPGAWIISDRLLDPQGHSTNRIRVDPSDSCVATRSCLNGFRRAITYQPTSRYWSFQWYETGVFVGAALILILASYLWIRHRAR
jgi:hypothetical protein